MRKMFLYILLLVLSIVLQAQENKDGLLTKQDSHWHYVQPASNYMDWLLAWGSSICPAVQETGGLDTLYVIDPKDARMILFSSKDSSDFIFVENEGCYRCGVKHLTNQGKTFAKESDKSLFIEYFPYIIDCGERAALVEHPSVLVLKQGNDTMMIWGLASTIFNYHLKNFEFKRGSYFILTRPWFQQKVVKGDEIEMKMLGLIRQKKRLNNLERQCIICDEPATFDISVPSFFELDFENEKDARLVFLDNSTNVSAFPLEAKEYLYQYFSFTNKGKLIYDVEKEKNIKNVTMNTKKRFLIYDEEASRYVKKIKMNCVQVPYSPPVYTKEEYEESISPCRKQK